MPKPDSLQGSLDLLVLKILLRKPGLHGYAIMSAIKDRSGEVLNAEEGSLYPALQRLLLEAWVKAEWKRTSSNRRVRVYTLTTTGRSLRRPQKGILCSNPFFSRCATSATNLIPTSATWSPAQCVITWRAWCSSWTT